MKTRRMKRGGGANFEAPKPSRIFINARGVRRRNIELNEAFVKQQQKERQRNMNNLLQQQLVHKMASSSFSSSKKRKYRKTYRK